MVRMSDLSESDQQAIGGLPCTRFDPPVWSVPKPSTSARFALVTTAGLHRRGEPTFELLDGSYRVIPGDVEAADLVMTHSSVNFDRNGFQEDTNVVFPIDRFRELAAQGAVGSLADFHYSFMGAGLNPPDYESSARELAGQLKKDRVDTVFLSGV